MNILWIVLEFKINIFQAIVMSYFAYSFLGDKNNKPYIKSASVIYAAFLEKAMAHIENIAKLLDNTETIIHTNNDIVNSVINSKLSSAKSFGIDFDCLSVSDFKGISDVDLCSLLRKTVKIMVTG